MSKTIGGSGHSLQCLNCGEYFGKSEFFDFLSSPKSQTIDCFLCPAENYLIPAKNSQYRLAQIFALLTAIMIFAASLYGIKYIWPETNIAKPVLGKTFIMVAFAIGGAGLLFGYFAYLIFMNIFNWKTGKLSLDKAHKSSADYEHY